MNTYSMTYGFKFTISEKQWAESLAVLFFLLAALYSWTIPIFEASDEIWHYPYVKQLADGRGLPVAGQDLLARQEATQSPFYYIIAAAATFWVDSDDLPQRLEMNPHWLDTSPRTAINDNQNMVVHIPNEWRVLSGTVLAVRIARMVSVLFGALAVWLTVRIAAELFPDGGWLAAGAGALVAFNPQFVRTSATVSNDAAVTALVALAVWLALRWSRPLPNLRQSGVLGIVAGLAVLTKLNGVVAVIMVMAIIAVRCGKYRVTTAEMYRRAMWISLASIFGVATIVSGWWFARNWFLYGELAATETHLNLAGRGHLTWSQIWALWPEIERTFWASFGWGQIRLADWIYAFFGWLRTFALAGVVLFLWQSIRNHRWQAIMAAGLLMSWAAIIAAMFVQWISLVGSVSHARLMFTALPAIAILIMLGWSVWFPKEQWQRLAIGSVAVVLFLVAFTSLWRVILPAYTPATVLDAGYALAELPPLGWLYGDAIRLETATVSPVTLQPGDTLSAVMFWRATERPPVNYSEFVRVIGGGEQVIAGRDTFPGMGLLPTRYWQPGQVVQDVLLLKLPSDIADIPQVAQVRVGLYNFRTADRAGLPTVAADGQPVLPVVSRVKIIPAEWQLATPQFPLPVQFADGIRLAGYDLTCAEACRLTLHWQPNARPNAAYTVFIQHWVHGKMVAGFDAPPRNGTYPTDWWDVGEEISDAHCLPRLSGGELRVGLYRLDTGERLPVLSADEHTADDALIIPVDEK